jgi:hypothetical protein
MVSEMPYRLRGSKYDSTNSCHTAITLFIIALQEVYLAFCLYIQ